MSLDRWEPRWDIKTKLIQFIFLRTLWLIIYCCTTWSGLKIELLMAQITHSHMCFRPNKQFGWWKVRDGLDIVRLEQEESVPKEPKRKFTTYHPSIFPLFFICSSPNAQKFSIQQQKKRTQGGHEALQTVGHGMTWNSQLSRGHGTFQRFRYFTFKLDNDEGRRKFLMIEHTSSCLTLL